MLAIVTWSAMSRRSDNLKQIREFRNSRNDLILAISEVALSEAYAGDALLPIWRSDHQSLMTSIERIVLRDENNSIVSVLKSAPDIPEIEFDLGFSMRGEDQVKDGIATTSDGRKLVREYKLREYIGGRYFTIELLELVEK